MVKRPQLLSLQHWFAKILTDDHNFKAYLRHNDFDFDEKDLFPLY